VALEIQGDILKHMKLGRRKKVAEIKNEKWDSKTKAF
jgi:hypothetical protein